MNLLYLCMHKNTLSRKKDLVTQENTFYNSLHGGKEIVQGKDEEGRAVVIFQLSYLVVVAGAAVALGVVPHLYAGYLRLKEEQRPEKKQERV